MYVYIHIAYKLRLQQYKRIIPTLSPKPKLGLRYPTKVGSVPSKSTCHEKLNAPGTA